MNNLGKNLMIAVIVALAAVSSCQPPKTPAPTASPPTATSRPTSSATVEPTAAPSPSPTSDQGAPQTQTGELRFAALRIFSQDQGYALALDGRFLRLDSGPAVWTDMTPPEFNSKPDARPTSVFFALDMEHVWLAYQDQGTLQILFNTSETGFGWQAAATLPSLANMQEYFPTSIFFTDIYNGWVWVQAHSGMNHVYAALLRTSDGGRTWGVAYDPSPPGGDERLEMKGSYSLPNGGDVFTFINSKDGFAGTGDAIKTSNGGSQWQPIVLPAPSGMPPIKEPYEYVAPPLFPSTREGIFPVSVFESENVYNPPGDQFQALPESLFLSRTNDGGQTWISSLAPGLLGSFAALEDGKVWFLGKSDPSPLAAPDFYQSLDGGKSWKKLAAGSLLPLGSQLQFVSPSIGYALGPGVDRGSLFSKMDQRTEQANKIFKTIDNGIHWSLFEPGMASP